VSKVTRILLAIGLILAVATPALAEFKFNGVYNLKSYVEEKKSTTGKEDGKSEQFIDQRFRAKLTYSLNDNVAVVYFAEVDTVWGEQSKGFIGDGGRVGSRAGGSDGVNVETKNVYLDLKSGNTAATLGITTLGDAFGGIVFFEDIPALNVTHKIGNTTLRAMYSKWDEDFNKDDSAALNRGYWDDNDFYAFEAKHKFNDNFTAGLGVYFSDNNTVDVADNPDTVANEQNFADQEIFFYGINADVRFGKFGIDGFAIMQDGEYDAKAGNNVDAKKSHDIEGWAATARAAMKLDNGDIGLRVIYFTEDDDKKDNGRWQGFQGEYFFVNDNQMQFLVDKFVANDGKEMYAFKDSVDQGFGLMAFVLSGNHKLPQDMYLNWGLGYYLAADDERDGGGVIDNVDPKKIILNERKGDTLGYEVAVRVGKKFFEKVDVSLNASYADYGDFYDKTINTKFVRDGDNQIVGVTGDDPDATYKAYLMVNVPF
jgi:hypothetical protein